MANNENVYDICIVGAGLVGSAAARHASVDSNLSVCLIGPLEPTEKERQNRSVFSGHYDEGRITRIFDGIRESQILNINAISRYHEIEALSGISFYKPVGCIYYGKRGSPLTNSASQDNQNLATLTDITSDFKNHFPFLELLKDEVAFLETSPAGFISARKLVAAQQKIAQMQGCAFVPEIVEKVAEEATGSNAPLVITTANGKEFRAKKVLLCTNAFTNFKQLLPEGKVADLEYEKSQVSLIKISEAEAERLRKMPSLIHTRVSGASDAPEDDYYIYALPPMKYPDGCYYVKIGWSPAGPEEGLKDLKAIREWYLGTGIPERTEILTEKMKKLIPGLKIESYRGMTCSTCHTLTKIPYIDMVTPKLGVAIGGCGTSAKSSDEVGRIGAKLAIDGVWTSEIEREKMKVQWK